MDEDLLAAVNRFASRAGSLVQLASRDETFRALCADFAAAQAALERWRASSSVYREQRCAEYTELLESLADEIAQYLDVA
jgi:acyl-CoA reductase-like NAD-dependent aldehyde dehydrogenase